MIVVRFATTLVFNAKYSFFVQVFRLHHFGHQGHLGSLREQQVRAMQRNPPLANLAISPGLTCMIYHVTISLTNILSLVYILHWHQPLLGAVTLNFHKLVMFMEEAMSHMVVYKSKWYRAVYNYDLDMCHATENKKHATFLD